MPRVINHQNIQVAHGMAWHFYLLIKFPDSLIQIIKRIQLQKGTSLKTDHRNLKIAEWCWISDDVRQSSGYYTLTQRHLVVMAPYTTKHFLLWPPTFASPIWTWHVNSFVECSRRIHDHQELHWGWCLANIPLLHIWVPWTLCCTVVDLCNFVPFILPPKHGGDFWWQ